MKIEDQGSVQTLIDNIHVDSGRNLFLWRRLNLNDLKFDPKVPRVELFSKLITYLLFHCKVEFLIREYYEI